MLRASCRWGLGRWGDVNTIGSILGAGRGFIVSWGSMGDSITR